MGDDLDASAESPDDAALPSFEAPAPVKHTLEYRAERRRRWYQRKSLMVLLLLLLVGALVYWKWYPIREFLRETERAWIWRKALRESLPAGTVVYEERTGEAASLLSNPDYVQLSQGATARQSRNWQALLTSLGSHALLMPTQFPGAAVFLHERWTPGGQKLIVYTSYCPDPNSKGTGGLLETLILAADGSRSRPGILGGLIDEDLTLFGLQKIGPNPLPHPTEHRLKVYAGQPDPADRTSFWIDYEVDGKRGRITVRILDPDPSSTVPTWPLISNSVTSRPSQR